MGHQEWAGRSRFAWQGSECCLLMVPRVLQVMSNFMAAKKLPFWLTWTSRRSHFTPFSGKSARKKMHALTSKAHCYSIWKQILMNSFSVTPYKYNKCNLCIWVTHLKALCSYRRFNKWSDFFGSPGMCTLLGRGVCTGINSTLLMSSDTYRNVRA